MKTNPQKIYEILTNNNGEWVTLDDICRSLGMERKVVSNNVNVMGREQPHLYPGIKKSSKRATFNNRFGQSQAKYDIKFKVEV